MSFIRKSPSSDSQPPASAPAAPSNNGPVIIRKGQRHQLQESAGGKYTIITTWKQKDYDLYALVEYVDGHVEVVSCFGTVGHEYDFSTRTKDGAVVHVSGDKATSDRGGKDLPQEVIHVTFNPNIKTIVPVVYSAKNSGVGSFYRYGVSTYVMEGHHQTVGGVRNSVSVEAVNASRDDNVYTFVPAVISATSSGPVVDAVEEYSRRSSELRPTVRNGRVSMDAGPENASKPRPKSGW